MGRPKIRDIFEVKLNDLFDKKPQGKVGRAKTEDIVGHLSNDELVAALDAWFQNVYNFVMEYHAFRNTGHHGSLDALRKAARELRYSFRDPILYMVMLRMRLAKSGRTRSESLAGALYSRHWNRKRKMEDVLKEFDFSKEHWEKEFVYSKPPLSTLIHRRRKTIQEKRLRERSRLKKEEEAKKKKKK